MRHPQFQHHDGDKDGNDAVTECGETIFPHSFCPDWSNRNFRRLRSIAPGGRDALRWRDQTDRSAALGAATGLRSSFVPASRLYPTTSAANIAASFRVSALTFR